jgi:hypothetical protein
MLEQDERSAHDLKRAGAGHLVRAFLLPVLVLLPTLGAAFAADKRFNIYRFGGEYSQRPWGVITDQVRNTDYYLTLGNFRPLGRMVERSQDLITFQLAELLSLPFHIAMRTMNIAAVGLLCVVCVLAVETVTSTSPVRHRDLSAPAVFLPVAFAALLVVVNGNSSVILFTDLYATSAAVIMGAAMLAARHGLLLRASLPMWAHVGALLLGVTLASFNEVAALALPLMIVALFTRGMLTMGISFGRCLNSAALKVTALTWLGFLAVAVPVRAVIARRCAEGQCYAASEVSLSTDTAVALAHRLASSLPGGHVFWLRSGELSDWRSFVHLPTILIIAAAALIAMQAVRRATTARGVPARGLLAAMFFGATLILLGAVMASMSRDLQEQIREGLPVGAGWRETLVVIAGMSILITGAVAYVAGRLRLGPRQQSANPVYSGAAAVLTFMVGIAMLGNATWTARQVAGDEPALHNRISMQMISPSSDVGMRCELLRRFIEINADEEHQTRLAEALDMAENSLRGQDWCEEN